MVSPVAPVEPEVEGQALEVHPEKEQSMEAAAAQGRWQLWLGLPESELTIQVVVAAVAATMVDVVGLVAS